MNKSNDSALSISKLMALHGWSLSKPTSSKITVIHADGSGAVLSRDSKDNSIAETLFYRMMDDFLTAK